MTMLKYKYLLDALKSPLYWLLIVFVYLLFAIPARGQVLKGGVNIDQARKTAFENVVYQRDFRQIKPYDINFQANKRAIANNNQKPSNCIELMWFSNGDYAVEVRTAVCPGFELSEQNVNDIIDGKITNMTYYFHQNGQLFKIETSPIVLDNKDKRIKSYFYDYPSGKLAGVCIDVSYVDENNVIKSKKQDLGNGDYLIISTPKVYKQLYFDAQGRSLGYCTQGTCYNKDNQVTHYRY